MLVFIDESGRPGVQVLSDSDAVFAIGMVIFANGEDAAHAASLVRGLHKILGHTREFRFSKCRDSVRDGFFQRIADCPFLAQAIVVRKGGARTQHSDSNSFYCFLLAQLLRHTEDTLFDARIRIDGSEHRQSQRTISSYLRREIPGKIRDVKMVDSAGAPLIQLADMCIGAVARAYRKYPDADRWLRMLRPRIRNVLEYK